MSCTHPDELRAEVESPRTDIIDGFVVDRRKFMCLACDHSWITQERLRN